MKAILALCAAAGVLVTPAALAAPFEHTNPVEIDGQMQFRFTDEDRQPYEVGYRLDGNTLHFPRGGKHTLPQVTEAEAERILRETYGLVGERDELVRTKGLD